MRAAISIGFCALLGACSAGDPVGVGPNDDGGSAGTAGKGASPGGASGSSGKSGGNGGSSAGGNGGSSAGGSSGASGSSSGGTGGGEIGASLDCTAPAVGNPTLRLLTRLELENTINDIFPTVAGQWTDSLPSNVVTSYGFDNDANAQVGGQLAGALLDTAVSVATAVTGSGLTNLLPCAAAAKDHACAQTFVQKYGRRLFRRPLTAAEETNYLTLFDSGLALSDFPTGLKWVTAGMIQSPNAVYRSELGTAQGGMRKLSGYEIATELAYMFSGSTPDEALLDAADMLATASPAELLTAAKALLAKPEGQEVVQRFFEAYLGYTPVTSAVRVNVPTLSALGPDMVKETRAFIADVLIAKPGGIKELLTAPTSNPSKALAAFYNGDSGAGFTQPGADYATVTRPADGGVGILAQGSFLASHANTDASSPTQRGLFVYYRLLCQAKLMIPPGVPNITEARATKTTRERYELAHTGAGSTCKSCHQFFDPLGFAFENFDEAGRFRTQQNGEPINTVASMPDENGNTALEFTTQQELVTKLAERPESSECFAAYLSTFAFGSSAACLGPSQAEELHAGTIGIVDAFAALVNEPHFMQRKAP